MAHVKLHIPGPVEVSAKTFQAMTQPMIGHRGQGFKDLYGRIQPQLQTLLSTRQRVYLSTSSAWGVMEGALINLVSKKVLNCMCGAFSDKWFDVSKKLGKDAEALQVPWGSPIRAEQIDARLATGQFDALTLIHNETSTGTMSPLDEIAALKRKYPDVMFIVDAVSSLTAVPHRFDELGIDILLAGTQKAFALPPGLAVFVASPAALAKAATIKTRGYYFDLLEFEKNAADNMTPSTPAIPRADIVDDGVAKDIVKRICLSDMLRTLADHHRELSLPVQLLSYFRIVTDWIVPRDYRRRRLGKNHRLFGQLVRRVKCAR